MKARRWMARVGAVLGIAVFGLVPTSTSQECPEYVGELNFPFESWGQDRIEVSGSKVYLGPRYRGSGGCKGGGYEPEPFVIIDVTDPDGPRVLGGLWSRIMDFSVSEDRLFFLTRACHETGHWEQLHIADISEPARPTYLLKGYEIDSTSWASVEVVNDTVFIVINDGLRVVDATDPSNPIEVGTLISSWGPSDVLFEGERLYVLEPDVGLRIIDVSDPTQPVEVGSFAMTWEAHDLEISDGYAFVADGAGGLRVIDVMNPSAPEEVGVLETESEALRVSVSDTHATVVLRDAGVLIVDLDNPVNPKAVGVFATEGPTLDAALAGSTAFVSESWSKAVPRGKFLVFDLTSPNQPVELASFGYRSTAMDVAVADGIQYVASGDTGLFIPGDWGDDTNFTRFLDTPGYALGVTVRDGFAFVADDHKGLRIIDAEDPMNMAEVGFVDTPGHSRRVAVSGDHAFVADGDGGLRVVDISSPSDPFEVGFLDTSGETLDVAVLGEYIYVADGSGGFRVIDASDPTQPSQVMSTHFYYPDAIVRGVAIAGNAAFVVFHSPFGSKLVTLDVSDPVDPHYSLAWLFDLRSEATDIETFGPFALVATRINRDDRYAIGGVEVFDISDPKRPVGVGSWGLTGDALGISASDKLIYLACESHRVNVLDSRCLTTYWVDIVASQSGLGGTEWRSDVIVSHEQWRQDSLYDKETLSDVGVEFILHTVDGQFESEAVIAREGQGVFEDIVSVFGYRGKGALEIRGSIPLKVSSRIYNRTESGTFGGYHSGYRWSDCLRTPESAWLYGLRQVQGKFRTNISVTNTGENDGRVSITLYDTQGVRLIEYELDVGPGMVVQDLQPFRHRAQRPNLGWGFAEVKVLEGDGRFLASASVIDTRANDAMMIPMTK